MIETKGNLFDDTNLNCIVCTINQIVKNNGELVMGAGIAKEFRDRYPFLAESFGKRTKFKESGILLANDIVFRQKESGVVIDYVCICGLPTKYDWRDKSDIDLIVKSCRELLMVANAFGWEKIGMTRPGCGNGGLNWDNVKNKISFLDDRFIIYVQ